MDQIGDYRDYDSKEGMMKAMKEKINPNSAHRNGAHATWQFLHEMKPGDMIFAKKGKSKILGKGIVESDYIYDPSREKYKNIRKVNWIYNKEYDTPVTLPLKTLTDISKKVDDIKKLEELYN